MAKLITNSRLQSIIGCRESKRNLILYSTILTLSIVNLTIIGIVANSLDEYKISSIKYNHDNNLSELNSKEKNNYVLQPSIVNRIGNVNVNFNTTTNNKIKQLTRLQRDTQQQSYTTSPSIPLMPDMAKVFMDSVSGVNSDKDNNKDKDGKNEFFFVKIFNQQQPQLMETVKNMGQSEPIKTVGKFSKKFEKKLCHLLKKAKIDIPNVCKSSDSNSNNDDDDDNDSNQSSFVDQIILAVPIKQITNSDQFKQFTNSEPIKQITNSDQYKQITNSEQFKQFNNLIPQSISSQFTTEPTKQ